MSKRAIGFFMVFIMMSMVFSGYNVFAAGENVEISGHKANDGNTIFIDEIFTLELTIQNNSGGDISKVWVSAEPSTSFTQLGRDDFIDSISAGDSVVAELDIRYTGYSGSSYPSITININYLDGNGKPDSDSETFEISNVEKEITPGPTKTPSVTDTTKYKPVLELESSAIPEGRAGGIIRIPISLTNVSDYQAKEIKITPVLSEDNPFSIDQMVIYERIEKILSKQTGRVEFQFEIDKNAQSKTYVIPFNIEYKNVYGDSFDQQIPIRVKITNTSVPPQLVVREAKSSLDEIHEDQEFTVTFDVWNVGTISAENVTVDLERNDNFYILDNFTKHYIPELKGIQNREITYTLKTKKEMESGTYPITIILKGKDMNPEEYTMYVNVLGTEDEEEEEEKDDINIVTENITTPQGVVMAEQPFTVSFNIKNIGTTKADTIKLTVDGGDKILPQSLNMMIFSDVEPGESIPVAFSFMAAKDSESKTYPIKAVIEYTNNGETIRKEQYMGVLIESPEEDEDEEDDKTLNTVPKIIISEYSMDPAMVNAGENFTLYMKFLNTSKIKAVQNMKITLVISERSEETGSVFTPVQSSNTFYIDYLAPGETSDKEMVMYTIPDAKAKTYEVKAVFEYEYEEDNQLRTNNMEDLFGIPVVQPAKLETTDVIVSEPAIVGEPVYIMSEFYNMGKVSLSNLMVKVEGEFDTRESNYFVGNFEIGSSDYYEGAITLLTPGETKGILVYTFEDSTGKSHRIEKEFTVNAMEAAPVMNPDFPIGPGMGGPGMKDPGMEDNGGSKFPIIPVAIGAGVVILIIVFIIVMKRRKKRKEMMWDEDI
jgi:hypothetical protein